MRETALACRPSNGGFAPSISTFHTKIRWKLHIYYCVYGQFPYVKGIQTTDGNIVRMEAKLV